MHIILLSGGSGKRLWPLSNTDRPKQFLQILPSPNGRFESMVQRVYRQIKEAGTSNHITVATGASQVALIREQLGYDVDIVQEPSRRDTYPAIALSCCYLAYEVGVSLNETVAVLPIDPYCDLDYFNTIKRMDTAAQSNFADMILMGIHPDRPSEKYGYIVPADSGTEPEHVKRFEEKPNIDHARELLEEGAVWNGGVFVFKLGYVINMLKVSSYQEALDGYIGFEKTSFDYAVVEKAESVGVVYYNGYWEDLGSWSELVLRLEEPTIGKVLIGEGTGSSQIINELDIPIVALGVRDLVVVASKEGILITGKDESAYLKKYVDKVG